MNIGFRVNCRDCGQAMSAASELLPSALYCKGCGLRATVTFEKIPVIKSIDMEVYT